MTTAARGAEGSSPSAPRGRGPRRWLPRHGAFTRGLNRLDSKHSPYLFIAPFFVLFAVFGIFPLVFTAWVSLHDWHIIGDREFVGLENYTRLLDDPRFLKSLVNTFSILIISTVPQLILALFLATVLHDRMLRGKQFFRVGLLLPNVTSVVAVAVIFESIFGLNYGIVNSTLGLLGIDRIDWQANRLASHIALSTMIMWRWTGYNALIYLAGLQSIPKDLYDAAAIDGASRWKTFLHVTLPGIRPVIIFTVILSTIGGLQIFAEPLVFGSGVSGGSNNQFLTTTLFLYGQAFRSFQLGYASAIAWILFLVIVLTALVNLFLSRRIKSAE